MYLIILLGYLDYFSLRLKVNHNEKRLKEEHELLLLKHAALDGKIKSKDRALAVEGRTLKDLADKKKY